MLLPTPFGQSAPLATTPAPTRMQWQTIQAVRGLAALMVVAFHLTQFVDGRYEWVIWLGLFERGFAGVDLFFVISGFVIVYTSQAYVGQPASLRTYLTKRTIRVYPVYWLTIAAMTLLMALSLWLRPDGVGRVVAERWPGLDTVLLLPHHRALNIVSWSLSHELFFYLLFACLILSRRLWVVPAFFLAATLYMAFAKRYYVDGLCTIWEYFWFNPLNAEFALGALAGFIFLRKPPALWVGLAAGALGVGWLFLFGETPNEALSERLLKYGIGSFLLLVAVLTYEYHRRPAVPAWLIRTGDASYLIYLIHTPLLLPFTRLLTRAFPTYSAGVPLACFGLVVLVTVLSIVAHRWVEKPLMRYLSARFLSKKIPASPLPR